MQYHIVFVCKYRKKLLISKPISEDIKQFSYEICQKHNVIIKYMETDKDHIHYMIETEPTMSISKIVNLVKSYTTYYIWEKYPNYLKKHFWKEHTFWTDGKYERKLTKLQRQLAHKEKGSNSYNRKKKETALCHEKITNSRKDYLHKISHEIVSENQVIVSENLQIKNMVKNRHLAKSISDVSWYELTRQLEYKAEWNKRKYVKIDKFYASSQLCSACGYQNADTKDLSVRTWICPKCGTEHDKDINAAKNILEEGLRQIP